MTFYEKLTREISNVKNRQEMIFTKQDQIQSTLHGDLPPFQSPTLSCLVLSPWWSFTLPTTSQELLIWLEHYRLILIYPLRVQYSHSASLRHIKPQYNQRTPPIIQLLLQGHRSSSNHRSSNHRSRELFSRCRILLKYYNSTTFLRRKTLES